VKQKVRDSLLREEPYNVQDYYHTEGRAQAIARSSLFENVTLGVIAFNAIWMAIDTDHNHAESLLTALPIFMVAENFFCFYFTFEVIVRFSAFAEKWRCLVDAWFVFDSVLVTMMIFETWAMTIWSATSGAGSQSPLGDASILRLFRLLRLARLSRMVRSLPELMILIKGMVQAMKSVFYVMLLLVIITYVFGIMMTQLTAGESTANIHAAYFEIVPLSMYSLLIYGTFLDDLSQFCDDIRAESGFCLFLVFIFIGLAAMTVMNMLIGVLCEVVSAVADTEREERLTVTVSDKMGAVLSDLDSDSNGKISLDEFAKILAIPETIRTLEEVGVDPIGLVDFAELFFVKEGECVELDFPDFMEMVLDLRDSNTATVKDVMSLWKQISRVWGDASRDLKELKAASNKMDHNLTQLVSQVKRVVDARNPSALM